MHSIRADKTNRRLTIAWRGAVSEKEMEDVTDQIKQAAAELEPHFDVIHDISRLSLLSEIVPHEIQEAFSCLQQKGLKEVIQIAGNQTANKILFETLFRDTGVVLREADSLSEAEAMLDRGNRQIGRQP